MRTFLDSLALSLLLCLGYAGTTFGAGSGGMSGGDSHSRLERASPGDQARLAFDTGVRSVQKADAFGADAARQTDAKKRARLLVKAGDSYTIARRKFTRATELDPVMHEAWNYLGYTNRKLGDYQAALSAYDRALNLKPGFVEAIEYRGHAYLGLNRLADAKDAYLSLFGSNRQLAAQLLAAMQEWVAEHRGNPVGVDGAALEAFASWISERRSIASQTAGLTREGAGAAW
jgi:tetratricopeptide (TPR) repeat protein